MYEIISFNDKFCSELSILKYSRYKYINHKKILELLKSCTTMGLLEYIPPYEKLIKIAYKNGKYTPSKEVKEAIDRLELLILKKTYNECLKVFKDNKLLDTIIFYYYFLSRFSCLTKDRLESDSQLLYEFELRNKYYPYDLFLDNMKKWQEEIKEVKN